MENVLDGAAPVAPPAAEPSPAPPVAAPEPISIADVLAKATPDEKKAWEATGKIPEPKPSVAATPAAETAPEPEPGEPKQESAEDRSKRDKANNERRFNRMVRETAQAKARADQLAQEIAALRQGKPESAPGMSSSDGEPVMPDIDTFEGTVAEFKDAMAAYKRDLVQFEQTRVNQAMSTKAAEKTQKQHQKQFQDSLVPFISAHEDFGEAFDAVAEFDETAPYLSNAIIASGSGPALIYHLGQHTEEMDRLAALPEPLALMELGKIAASLSVQAPAKVKTTTSAPHPGKTVSGTSTAVKDPIKAAEEAGDWTTYNRLVNARELERRTSR